MNRPHGSGREAGYTILEIMVATTLFMVMMAALGTAFGTGGQVYGDGLLRAELNGTARATLNRMIYEMEATRTDSPDFVVNGNSITYNRVEAISADTATFGSARTISYAQDGTVTIVRPADGVKEQITDICSGLTFALDDSLLTISIEVGLINSDGVRITQAVTGDVNLDR